MEKFLAAVAVSIGAIVLVCFIAVVCSIPTWLLWNWVVPDITKGAVTEINLLQALGLNILCGILFKSSSSGSKNSD